MPYMLFRKFYEEEVKARLRKIYRARDFYRDSDDDARSNASDSNNSLPAGDDVILKTSEKKRSVSSSRKKPSVRPSEPVGIVGCSSASSGKQNTKANRSKRRRIYNLKQKKKKRLEKNIYLLTFKL